MSNAAPLRTAAAAHVERLRRRADEYHFGRISYESFHVQQRAQWNEIESVPGLQPFINALLRGDAR